jgi:hypothetical protein
MPELVSDGTTKWLGGMDTSRSPADIGKSQYSKACNVIIPNSLGGITARFGFHCCKLNFENRHTKDAYRSGKVQGEGYFTKDGKVYLICVASGYIFKFEQTGEGEFTVTNLNKGSRNSETVDTAWVIQIPGGCIVNNGVDIPFHVTPTSAMRTDPANGGIGVGKMGVYVQFRLFYVDADGKRILASDFMQPTKNTLEDTNIFGFMCPDDTETITAIAKQKSIIGTVEGGNLIWSSNKDIYSADVRGTRSEWANLGSAVGKVSETVPGFSASSSYSFEVFNTNIYFRSSKLGIADMKQSEYQFVNLDAVGNQSSEADYYLDSDDSSLLGSCYSRACNKRMFTTVSPRKSDIGGVIWGGILSFNPATIYSGNETAPRRFESVFTGLQPWCMTAVTTDVRDILYVHSRDKDGINRMYWMNESSNYDLDESGAIREIEGFIETRAYDFDVPLLIKNPDRRFYRLNLTDRTISINVFVRPEVQGGWSEMSSLKHLICRDGESSRGQTRPFVVLPEAKFSPCYEFGRKFIVLQYRIEFVGPLNLDSIISVATQSNNDLTVSQPETCCVTLSYDFRPDYYYSIRRTSI